MRRIVGWMALALAAGPVFAAGEAPAASEAPAAADAAGAVIARLAPKSLLLDVQAVPGGQTLVAVGERGHVLESTDGGATWKQQATPTRANLTAVYFVDAQHGWAVGHDEVILRTADGGRTWTRTHYDPGKQQPLLDVWFANPNDGFAIGAFSAVYRTTDGGATWSAIEFAPQPLVKPAAKPKPKAGEGDDAAADAADDEGLDQPHLNAIAGGNGKVYIGAEAGHLYRSDDGGATWLALPSPYEGSFFGLLPLDGDSLLAFGLRGHLFRSDDAGATWTKLDSGTTALLSGGARLADGTIVIAGMSGTVVFSRDGGRTFAVHQEADRKGFAAVAPGAGGIVLAGEAGVRALGADALKR